jgi:nitroimidazol reductase NimA-like FMN-containing flavoprotein (pyridoxamine 5'-phosphate oxidase superfamily)
MLTEMKQLMKEQNLCVLATISGNQPYCSLMAYAANEEGTELYLATFRSSKKFSNLAENPAVSLLIDTREDAPRALARALTVGGTCARIEDDTTQAFARARLLSIHPHLRDFLAHPDCELVCVRIGSFLLLKGLTEAHRATLE